ncbi:MAG: pyridoxal phosphate-dependent aminotransferase [Myxococcota bacterium]
MFARRAAWDLLPNALAARLAAHAAAGRPLLDLADANPTACGIDAPGLALRDVLRELAAGDALLRYAPDACGDAAARAAVAAHHAQSGGAAGPATGHAGPTADDVVLTAGTSEGYAHLFRLLADPGDVVHVPTPGYPLFAHLAELEGLEVRAYPLRPRRGPRGAEWRIDLDALAADLSPRSRAIVAIDPHSPTGARATDGERASLASIAEERGLALVVDEVFAAYPLAPVDAARAPSAFAARSASGDAAADGPLRFALSGASKLLGLPQAKVSWIVAAGPEVLRREAVERLAFIADAYLSVSPVVAHALPALLARGEELRAPIRARVRESEARLRAVAASHPALEVLAADAGWSAIVRVRAPGGDAIDEEALAIALLERDGVRVHPGFLFDLPSSDERGDACAHVVLSLLAPPDAIERGAGALARRASALATDPGRSSSERPAVA